MLILKTEKILNLFKFHVINRKWIFFLYFLIWIPHLSTFFPINELSTLIINKVIKNIKHIKINKNLWAKMYKEKK